MSQSTADLLNNLGLAQANVNTEIDPPSAVETAIPSRHKPLVIGVIAAVVLGTGFKLIGDFAADRAIDAWTARQIAPFTEPSPLAYKILEAGALEEMSTQAAQEDSAATEAESVSLGE